MNKKSFILAGDIGTTSIKAALFDCNLQVIADSSYSLKTHSQQDIPGSAVQNPEQWMHGFIKCIDCLYEKAPLEFPCISILSLTGQMEDLIIIDKEEQPLYDALLYSDSRAKEETEIITGDFGIKKLFEITGNEFNVFNSITKILWCKRKIPDLFSKSCGFIFGSKDFINFKLTGKSFTDYTTASTTGLFNIDKREWEKELISYLNIQNKSLPEIDRAGSTIGEIKEQWISALHLNRRIPVLNGMGDAASATMGAGIFRENEAYIYGGTTGWVALLSTKKREIPVYNLLNHDGLNYINVSPILNAGNAIDWGIKHFYVKSSEGNISYKIIDDLVEKTDTRADIIFLPYLNGERSPFHDEAVRGMIFGITLNTKSEHILKAVFEGVAFSFHHNIITLGTKNTKSIPITGGISEFDAFCQILSHISGNTVEKLEKDYSNPLFGTALLASQNLSIIPIKDVSDYVRVKKRYYPKKSKAKRYSRLFDIYRGLYPNLKQEFKKLNDIQYNFN